MVTMASQLMSLVKPIVPLLLELGGILVVCAALVVFLPLPLWTFGLTVAVMVGLVMVYAGIKLEGGDR